MYCYKVRYWDYDKSYTETGLVAAKDANEAMTYITERFGATEIDQMRLAVIGDDSVDEHILPFGEFDCGWSTFVKEENF